MYFYTPRTGSACGDQGSSVGYGNRVTDGCKPAYGCWELNPSSLQEQPALHQFLTLPLLKREKRYVWSGRSPCVVWVQMPLAPESPPLHPTPTACVAARLSYQRAFTSIISLIEAGRRPLSLCSLTDKVPRGPAEPSVFSPGSTQNATTGSAPFREGPTWRGERYPVPGTRGSWLPPCARDEGQLAPTLCRDEGQLAPLHHCGTVATY